MSKKITYRASITNGCQGGGDKKAGLVPTATSQMLSQPFAWQAALGGQARQGQGGRGGGRGNGGNHYFIISTVNQLGGVGRYRSATNVPTADGAIVSAIKASAVNCNKQNIPILNFKYKGTPNIGYKTRQVFVCPNAGMGATQACIS